MSSPASMNLSQLKQAYRDLGASRVFVKALSPNDNSKNQVYLGGSFEVLNMFPISAVTAEDPGPWERARFKAQLPFSWMDDTGILSPAPHAQLILYPKYPEVRLSGFLKSCANAPSHLMRERLEGRLLFLATIRTGGVVAYVAPSHSQIALSWNTIKDEHNTTVLHELPLSSNTDTKGQLLTELARIADKGWIRSKRLDKYGVLHRCESTNCGGLTLEAELGISANGSSDPDFLGWEIKQFAQKQFARHTKHAVTLMTPEPTGGLYKLNGIESFVRQYGYPDKRGRPDRINFGGVHRAGETHSTTHLRMEIIGFNPDAGKISNAGGRITLLDINDNEAASWGFDSLLLHWNKKHNKACYVPSLRKNENGLYYRYGGTAILGQGTDFTMFLNQLYKGVIYYDPGIKLEAASTGTPTLKRRSQFRVSSSSLNTLYHTNDEVTLS